MHPATSKKGEVTFSCFWLEKSLTYHLYTPILLHLLIVTHTRRKRERERERGSVNHSFYRTLPSQSLNQKSNGLTCSCPNTNASNLWDNNLCSMCLAISEGKGTSIYLRNWPVGATAYTPLSSSADHLLPRRRECD